MSIPFRPKPAYGAPCNNCGLCCIAVQCAVSLAVFGEQDICPALGMAEPGNFGCRMVENPRAFIPEMAEDMEPTMREFYALLLGAGIGCDGTMEGENEPTDAERERLRARAREAVMRASPEALALIEYAAPHLFGAAA